MARFSDRIGVTQARRALQVDAIDDDLRNSLWNFVLTCFGVASEHPQVAIWQATTRLVAQGFFKVPLDRVPQGKAYDAREWLHERFFAMPWFQVYNFIEFLVDRLGQMPGFPYESRTMADRVNDILAAEMSAYRFIEGELAPISNEAEVAAIEDAVQVAADAGLDGVHAHVRAALSLLAKKPDPDFRNSIKESISAVESAAKLVSGLDKGELKDALSALEKKVELHGALKKGFLSLYGYSSDSDGIRHALLEEPTVGFDEAKFMLVSCSAFSTFLISKAASAGVLPDRLRAS